MSLSPGTRLGPYEVLAPLGAGGMGEVYRARDPRLGREVAIKVLPEAYSADPERLHRFEHEARAAGILNHPNITAVYDTGTREGAPYVVQELLEGETLSSALTAGALPPRRAIDYALQIALGLAAAHEKIVHRDLKPENIFVTEHGRIKILDFGLAKLTHQEEGGESGEVSGSIATAVTEPGIVLGTMGYMSPEQAKGKHADARSDIFSFGAILYEMLSGRRAFRGDSAVETMAAILREEPPDLSATNRSISPGLDRIVRHAIEKNPEQRFHSAHDVALALEELSGTSATSAGVLPFAAGNPSHRVGRLGLAGLAVVALASAAAAGHFVWRSEKPPPPTFRRLTFRRGNLATARFTPDGHGVVYGASWEGQPYAIFTTRLGGPESTPLGVNANVLSVSSSGELAISLNERSQGMSPSLGTLATVPLGGGAPRSIAEFVDFADWTPDGRQLAVVRFFEGRNRLELPLGKVLYSTPRGFTNSFAHPRISPKGDRIALLQRGSAGATIVTVELAGQRKTLTPPGVRVETLAWSPSGEEIWFDDIGERGEHFLKAVDLSGRVRTLYEAPIGLLLHDIARDGRVLVERANNQRGIFALAPGETRERDLSWFDAPLPIRLSDDGRLLLFREIGDTVGGGDGVRYLRKTDGSPAVKLEAGDAFDLSSDGKWVLVRAADNPRTLILQPTGTGVPISIDLGAFESVAQAVLFPDARRLLFAATDRDKKRLLYVKEIPAGKPRALSSRELGFGGRPISPDGLWVAAQGEYSEGILLLPTSGGEPRTVPNSREVSVVCWSADGKSLFAEEWESLPKRVVRINVETGRRELWKSLTGPDLIGLISVGPVLMTPDARQYAYGYLRSSTSELYLVEGLK